MPNFFLDSDLSPLGEDARSLLQHSGWAMSSKMATLVDGSFWWEVWGWRRGDIIAGDGATTDEAWLCAMEQARPLG